MATNDFNNFFATVADLQGQRPLPPLINRVTMANPAPFDSAGSYWWGSSSKNNPQPKIKLCKFLVNVDIKEMLQAYSESNW